MLFSATNVLWYEATSEAIKNLSFMVLLAPSYGYSRLYGITELMCIYLTGFPEVFAVLNEDAEVPIGPILSGCFPCMLSRTTILAPVYPLTC